MAIQQRLDKKHYFKTVIVLILCLSVLFWFGGQPSLGLVFAQETNASPNYLVLLVHGINTTHRVFMGQGEEGSDVSRVPDNERYPFGDLKGYLDNTLGLKGYVYAYTFSERDGRIDLMADELGNLAHDNRAATIGGTLHLDSVGKEIGKEATGIMNIVDGTKTSQGNSWLEQAREDFISDFTKREKRPPTEAEIPKKYIIIAHSLGGLAARSYLASENYTGDGINTGVVALITIASQHNGSDSALALKRMDEFYSNNDNYKSIATLFGVCLVALSADHDEIARYCGISAFLMASGRTLSDLLVEDGLGWYTTQPGVQDVDSQGEFIRRLNDKDFVRGNVPIKLRFISVDGIPTPSGDLPTNRYLLGLSGLQTMFSSGYINDLPLGSKIMAVYMSEAMGAIMNQNGDLYSTKKSQEGAGQVRLHSPNIDFKTYSIRAGSDWGIVNDALSALAGGMVGVEFFTPIKTAQVPIKLAFIAAAGFIIANEMQERVEDYISGHGLALKWVYEQGVIDQALDGILPIGGRAPGLSKSGISAMFVNSPTAGYLAPEQAFDLLSDLDAEKRATNVFHTVTIEAFTEGNPNSGMFFPIKINGTNKWVSAVTVKEPPTAIKGVINTYLPKKLKQFQYSENFAAWKDVGAVDAWGNFTLKGLKFAEGQNVVAFQAESWTGNKSNQQLKIILNTIPCFPGNYYPADGAYTNNPRQKAGVEFRKSKYAGTGQGFHVLTCEMDGAAVTPVVTTGEADYIEWIKVEIVPPEPLADGEHRIAIKVQSDVGVSQALWSYTVDTVAPGIIIEPLKPVSFQL